MATRINSIYSFLNKFAVHIEKKDKTQQYYVYSGYKEYGSLLIKNIGDKGILIFKPWDTERRIGRNKVKKFIDNYPVFKGHSIDRYIFLGRNFKDIAKRYTRSEDYIALIEVSIKTKIIDISGSMNIERTLLNTLIEFAEKINFKTNFDYEGILRHQQFINGVQEVKQIEESMPNPTVFISYSWDSEDHKSWVLKLAANLLRSGIKVFVDEWDLKDYNNDLHLFIESGIRDSRYVIMVCTPEYAEKANMRKGGVGIENTIITGEFYDKEKADKYIPIGRNYSVRITDCLPSYLKSTYTIDFKSDEKYDQKFEELLRRILNV